jgi:hypothetical protein
MYQQSTAKNSQARVLSIRTLVRQVALKWNTLYPSLVQMDSELEKLGLQLVKGGVAMYDPGEEMGCV